MMKRLFLFLLTNILVIATIGIMVFILSSIFNINILWFFWTWNYISLAIYSIIVWFTWAFISLFMSKWLAKRTYNIELIEQLNLYNYWWKEKFVYEIVERIANQERIEMPEVWIYYSDETNAFATWYSKNNSLVAVSSWLLNTMNYDEIEWVIAHEMAHITNGDMVTMTLMQWVINTFVVFLSRILSKIVTEFLAKGNETLWSMIYFIVSIILDILLWILWSILVLAYSRHREYKADEWSSDYVWRDKMIAALRKLQIISERWNVIDDWKLSTFKISGKSWIMSLFSTHPDLQERINNLQNK